MKVAIIRKQRRSRLTQFPVLLPQGHRISNADGSLALSQTHTYDELGKELVAGSEAFGSITNRIVKRLEMFDPPSTFHCRCRVTGREQNWGSAVIGINATKTRGMNRAQCEEWTYFGDLLVIEADKVMAEHGINDTLGLVRLARVYEILDQQSTPTTSTEGISVHESSEPPIEYVRLEKALDAKFFHYKKDWGSGALAAGGLYEKEGESDDATRSEEATKARRCGDKVMMR